MSILNTLKPKTVLDIACGSGWIGKSLDYRATLHGIDYYAPPPEGYEVFQKTDFNLGIPDGFGQYDAAICCEAMMYLMNPGLFLTNVRNHLKKGATLIISVPNPTYAGARLNQLIQGYPRSYSHFVRNVSLEPHMPWLTLGLFQFWLLLGLTGFKDITVHEVDEKKPKRFWEFPVGILSKWYYRNRLRKAESESERRLWSQALSNQVVYGRQLVVSAVAA